MTIVGYPKVKNGKKAPEKKFYWTDNIQVESQPIQATIRAANMQPGKLDLTDAQGRAAWKVVVKLDVDKLRADQLWRDDTDTMIADVTSIFKKLHVTKAGLAVQGQQGFYCPLVKKPW